MKVNAETSPPEHDPPAAVAPSVEEGGSDCGESLEVGLWLRGLVVWKLLLGLSAEALSSEHWDTFASTCVSKTKHQHVANRGYQHHKSACIKHFRTITMCHVSNMIKDQDLVGIDITCHIRPLTPYAPSPG
jgi:hypothetical protein